MKKYRAQVSWDDLQEMEILFISNEIDRLKKRRRKLREINNDQYKELYRIKEKREGLCSDSSL